VVVGALTLHVRSAGGGLSGVRRWTAWGGTGPGMFLGAALMLAAMLSAFLLLGAGDWLNGANSASSLIDGRAASGAVTSPGTDACGAPCPPPDPVLRVPMPYVLFGTATLAAVLLFGLVVVVMLWRTRNPDIPAAPTTPADAAATTPAVTRSRRFAAIAHRAEKLVALLVLIDLAMVLFALIFAVSGSAPWDKAWGGSPFLRRLTDLATAGVALLAVGVLAAAVGGGVTGNKRPLGLVWDLVCFLPRAAHPFGPPCYAERAVPELSARVSWWLAQPDRMVDDQRRGGRAVVLSAHSLGGVLAVAVLLGRSLRAADARPAVRFLTYGCQLRAYVSRVFPELLGPAVLGTPPVRAARFWTKDPWSGEIAEGTRPADETLSMSVVRQLTPPTGGVLWRNLWRRTDYLGFPVWSYEPNDIDAGAEELDHTAYLAEVVSHSNYPRSQAYRTALDELAEQA
jgi:hypothetical protein